MTIRACGAGDTLLAEAEDEIRALEGKLSATDPESDVGRLNAGETVTLSPETRELLGRALALCALTDGAIDITVRPLVTAWGFTADAPHVPEGGEIAEALSHVDYTAVRLSGEELRLPAGCGLDLGCIAKGYAGDRLLALLAEGGITSAILDLGGNVQTLGTRPDGTPWRVAVRSPEGDGYLGTVEAADCAVVTSGAYERFFIDDEGKRRGHILDPGTGCPAESGLLSATVIAEEGTYADALSTALFVMGEERAVSFWQAQGDFEMILATEDGRLLYTEGLTGVFTPDADCGFAPEVIPDA